MPPLTLSPNKAKLANNLYVNAILLYLFVCCSYYFVVYIYECINILIFVYRI